jgi:hypothetical protein
MTQELIADMLGVRREGVTVAAGRLHDAGAISYVRGRITILDRHKLEKIVCECYQVVKDEFDRLLGTTHWASRKLWAFGSNFLRYVSHNLHTRIHLIQSGFRP